MTDDNSTEANQTDRDPSEFIKREGKTESGKSWAFTTGGAGNPKAEDAANTTEALFAAADNVAAIVGMAYMEERVRELLEKFFVDDTEAQKRIFDPLKPGPLGAFAPMVNIAFLLGLLPKETCQTLKKLASVRNSFAHNHRLRTFSDFEKADGAKESLKDLMKLNWMEVSEPRAVFNAIYLETLAVLRAAHIRVADQRRKEIQVSDIIVIGRGNYDASKKGETPNDEIS